MNLREQHKPGKSTSGEPRWDEVSDENKALMRKIVEMFATGDVSDIEAVIAAAYVEHQGLRGIDISGVEGFRRVVTAARGAVPDLRVDIEDLIAEGDRLAARLRWHGTQQSENTVDRETIDIVRFARGRAVEHWGVRLWISEGQDPNP